MRSDDIWGRPPTDLGYVLTVTVAVNVSTVSSSLSTVVVVDVVVIARAATVVALKLLSSSSDVADNDDAESSATAEAASSAASSVVVAFLRHVDVSLFHSHEDEVWHSPFAMVEQLVEEAERSVVAPIAPS